MSTSTTPGSPRPDDDLPPHLASPEAFARWCREHPEGVRQMEINARRMELGEFGDVTPEMQATVTKFLNARKQMREAEAMTAELLPMIAVMRETLAKNPASVPSAHLAEQLVGIEEKLKRGEPFAEEWADFRLQYEAFQGELMGSIWKRTAMIAMSADAHDRRDPQRFAQDANAQDLLRQWRTGGMRERIFGSLPLAERRELEALEREWRDKPPGSAT
ncbi:MAG: hypothetical protein RL514_3654 [Verrucomicrobiota bacterium]|jgi:hypothetical protein